MRGFRRVAAACLLPLLLCGCFLESHSSDIDYGVFIGADPEDIGRLPVCETIVVDGEYFSPEEIGRLRRQGSRVYSYLNIGSVETFRACYPDFREMTLGAYENWPEEFWMVVSRKEWRQYILKAAGELAEKGVDGFFLDNADVYDRYPSPEIFEGLAGMIGGLGRYEKDLIINGGDVFVTKAVLEAKDPLPVTGVNQECVFTAIDFENGVFLPQRPEETGYFLTYLRQCQKAGLRVYLLEYAPADGRDFRRGIKESCEESGFLYAIASSIALDGG